eukprot:3236223-Prymnesium_polylepis.1
MDGRMPSIDPLIRRRPLDGRLAAHRAGPVVAARRRPPLPRTTSFEPAPGPARPAGRRTECAQVCVCVTGRRDEARVCESFDAVQQFDAAQRLRAALLVRHDADGRLRPGNLDAVEDSGARDLLRSLR